MPFLLSERGFFFPLYDRLEFPFCPSLSSRKFGVFPSDFGPFPPSPPYTLEDFFHAPLGSFSPLTPLRTFFTLHWGPFPPLHSWGFFSRSIWVLFPPCTLEDLFRAPFGPCFPSPFPPFSPHPLHLSPPLTPPPHMAAVRFVVTPSRGADLSESSPEPPSASSSRPPPSDSSPSASETSAAAAAPRGERPLAAGGL